MAAGIAAAVPSYQVKSLCQHHQAFLKIVVLAFD
jgi:hypothetical protein